MPRKETPDAVTASVRVAATRSFASAMADPSAPDKAPVSAVPAMVTMSAWGSAWNRVTSEAVLKAGGHSAGLSKHLPGEVLHDIEYFDTSPMAQFAVRRDSTSAA